MSSGLRATDIFYTIGGDSLVKHESMKRPRN